MYILLFTYLLFLPSSLTHQCGKSMISNKTNNQHFQWIAEMFSTVNRTKDGRFQHLCGSTIISHSFSVTAAHCIQNKNSIYKRSISDIFLVADVLDLKDLSSSKRIDITNIFSHPSWNPENETFDGDVALLKFQENLNFSINLSPICLWTGNAVINTIKTGTIITFIALEPDDPGYFNYQHGSQNFPRQYQMSIRDSCTKVQKRFVSIASKSSYCAGGLNSGACLETGSSGSSMAVEIKGNFYLRGIVSASFIDFAGCDNYTFTLFTDALKYTDWINGILG